MKQQMKTRRPEDIKQLIAASLHHLSFPIAISTPIHQISAMPPEHHKKIAMR